jgi:hypothetical protein
MMIDGHLAAWNLVAEGNSVDKESSRLLPWAFTLGDLQYVYERMLGRRIDKSAFRKRVAESGRPATDRRSFSA